MLTRRAVLAAPAAPKATDYRLFDTNVLAPPTFPTVKLLLELGLPVTEIGSGNGYWVRALRGSGLACTGYDIRPRGPDVFLGDHAVAAAKSPQDVTMLAVWPPDGREVVRWITAKRWRAMAVIGDFNRINLDGLPPGLRLLATATVPPGNKLIPSELRLYAPS